MSCTENTGGYAGRSARFWFNALSEYVEHDAALSDYSHCITVLRGCGLEGADIEAMGLGSLRPEPKSVLFRYYNSGIAAIPYAEEDGAARDLAEGHLMVDADRCRIERHGIEADAWAEYDAYPTEMMLYAARPLGGYPGKGSGGCFLVYADEENEKMDVDWYPDLSGAQHALNAEYDRKGAELGWPLSSVNEDATYAVTEDEDGWKYCWKIFAWEDIQNRTCVQTCAERRI